MSRRVRLAVFMPALAGFAALLLWGFAGLPDFGHYQGQYGFVLNRIAVPERHVTNVVGATVFDYRGFDTLGEEFLLFIAVLGVVLLLRSRGRREAPRSARLPSPRILGLFAVGTVALVGLWLTAFGYVTPGGGFQGGVAIASGVLLVYLTVGYRAYCSLARENVLDPVGAAGAGGFVVVGLAALVSGLPFLHNLLGSGEVGTIGSGGSIGLLNWAAAVEVAAANVILFSEFLDEYLVPLARRQG